MEDSVLKYDLFQKAYKKLKSTAYYDKTNLHLRDRIAEAENTLNITIEERLKDLHQAFVASDSTKWKRKKEDILESISCRLLPKKIMDTKEEKNCSDGTKGVLISGVPAKQVKVDEIQYFIDMKIEGMILGVLWIMMIGWQLDKSYTNCYGNRIRKTLYNEFSKEPTFSPALFEPYFQNYESWRDQALTLAQKCMQQDDVLIFTLDFKRYYYSVDVSEKFMKEILTRVKGKSDYNEEYLSRINDFVYCVIKRYSQIYREHSGEERIRRILPIGFLPSGVLANECLKKFDTAILDGWNPLYYGRYVDDILLVEKVEKGSRIAQKAQDGKLEFYEAFEYYTVNNSRWTGKENRNARAVFKKEEDECGTYCILPEFTKPLGSATKIQLQASKIKLFYFQRGQSDALITCFKNSIEKNKSEFRWMPEDDAVFQEDDYSEVFELSHHGVNKLREVDDIAVDKYALSKYLGKLQRINGLISEKTKGEEYNFVRDIHKIFTPKLVDCLEKCLIYGHIRRFAD